MKPDTKGFIFGALTVIVILLILRFYFSSEEVEVGEAVDSPPDTVTVFETKICTVKVTVRDSIYIREYVPFIEDSIAILDTAFVAVDSDTLSIVADIGIKFDLRERLFKDLRLGFPKIEYTRDTTFVERLITREITITKTKKPSFWKYAEAGLIGGAAALIIYGLIQGF